MYFVNTNFQFSEEKIKFSDVNKESWFYNPVINLVNLGYINGYKDGTFRPSDNITLGEFLKIIMTSTTNKKYKKIENKHWAYDIYLDAVVKAVIDSANFKGDAKSLNTPITREDMAYILIGVSENILGEKEVKYDKSKIKIKDIDKATDIKVDSIYSAYEKGLINGKDGKFFPKENLTRAQAATIIIRLLNKEARL